MGIASGQQYSRDEQQHILGVVATAKQRGGLTVDKALAALGLPRSSYYRWQQPQDTLSTPAQRKPDAEDEHLAVLRTHRSARTRLMPVEEAAVVNYALRHPRLGYKRLAWQMIDENVAFVTPYRVYQVFEQHDLFARRGRPVPEMLRRPPEAARPDQRWHVDLMYVWIDRWYFLCDILDAYSRFLVHWRLNLTMQADGVKLVVQEALDRLEIRRKDEPEIVHDHGSQFISGEWRKFIYTNEAKDIATKVAHPQSNGRLERLHRTHREEGLADEPPHSYHHALEVFHKWDDYYNQRRPHSQLNYLCPVDYYRGDPATRLRERAAKLAQARLTRAAYWKEQSQP